LNPGTGQEWLIQGLVDTTFRNQRIFYNNNTHLSLTLLFKVDGEYIPKVFSGRLLYVDFNSTLMQQAEIK
jgi:hypothetical protein